MTQREEQIKYEAVIAAENQPEPTDYAISARADHFNGFVEGFKEGAAWADSNPRWIPVEEYPKVDISCTLLVHYIDGEIDICDYYGDFYDYTGENVTRNITHWMPLPAPPKKGGQENG